MGCDPKPQSLFIPKARQRGKSMGPRRRACSLLTGPVASPGLAEAAWPRLHGWRDSAASPLGRGAREMLDAMTVGRHRAVTAAPLFTACG